MRDSLVGLAAAMRAAVDAENPEVPMGTMQSGAWDKDGDATEAVTCAMAGPRHTPFCRLHGTFYGGENIPQIPEKLFHALYTKQHVGENFRCYHESDTFPHTRFFTSGACMRSLMGCAYSFGFAGSTFQTQQLLDDANEEKVYGDFFKKERPRMETIAESARKCRVKGVGLLYDPFWATAEKGHQAAWCGVLSAMSIPWTTLDSPVTFLSGRQPERLSDEELRRLFSKTLFLDGEAADALCRRGYSSEIGVETGPDPVTGMNVFDLAGREVIQPHFIRDNNGRHMHRADFFSPNGKGVQFALKPSSPECEIVSRLVSYDRKELSVGMTRFVNASGGCVVVINQGVTGNRSSSLFNYRRQKLFHELLIRSCDEFVFAENAPRVFLIQNEAVSPEKAGFFGMLTITNLNPDPLEGITLHLPSAWQGREFLRLGADGEFHPCPAEATCGGIRLAVSVNYACPEVLIARCGGLFFGSVALLPEPEGGGGLEAQLGGDLFLGHARGGLRHEGPPHGVYVFAHRHAAGVFKLPHQVGAGVAGEFFQLRHGGVAAPVHGDVVFHPLHDVVLAGGPGRAPELLQRDLLGDEPDDALHKFLPHFRRGLTQRFPAGVDELQKRKGELPAPAAPGADAGFDLVGQREEAPGMQVDPDVPCVTFHIPVARLMGHVPVDEEGVPR